MRKIAVKAKNKAAAIGMRFKKFISRYRYVSGITVIELVLILVIVIALLLIFKSQLINLINTIFDKITSESSAILYEKG